MAKKAFKNRKGPDDCIPQQRRYDTDDGDGIAGTARPTGSYVDYETEHGGEFQIPQAPSGHGSFMYHSTTKGKKE